LDAPAPITAKEELDILLTAPLIIEEAPPFIRLKYPPIILEQSPP
jgi:hypothetical protein